MRTITIRGRNSMCKQRLALCVGAAFIFYLLLYPRTFHHSEIFHIPNAVAKDVWEYVADFSNMPKLNPTILNWELLSEKGHYEHWQYSVRYRETLSSASFTNYATAHYQVKPEKQGFLIQSTHITCFYSDFLCLSSTSEFRFTETEDVGKGTLCVEDIYYSCPWILGSLCRREVLFQRSAIRNNLQIEFS